TGTNYWKESQTAVKMQQEFCKNHGHPDGMFGITACSSEKHTGNYEAYRPVGDEDFCPYSVDDEHLPKEERGKFGDRDDGTIAPPAVLACLPFDKDGVKKAYNYLKEKNLVLDDKNNGICNAYNDKTGWKAPDQLAIDLGSMLLMLDKYHSGTIQKLINKNEIIQKIMQRAGFKPDPSITK
ncbi:MAG: glucoamylase family protein, partial [Candidatus Gastranaerophilaceae bacterium]